jgi:hypothetical protein
MTDRIVYKVRAASGLHGSRARYNITYERGGNNWVATSPADRIYSFATMSGAQRKCDELNAAEHKRVSG